MEVRHSLDVGYRSRGQANSSMGVKLDTNIKKDSRARREKRHGMAAPNLHRPFS
jgi:hypothetical protein